MKLQNKKKLMITFSDAMNHVDKNTDYNEYNEINSSAYFKDTLNNAEDEINKMMSSPLISNYRKFKRTDKTYSYFIHKDKEFILKRFLYLNEKAKKRKERQIEEKNRAKKKFKVNPFFDRLSKIKYNFSKTQKTEPNDDKNKKQKLLLTSGNVPFFPKINKNFNGKLLFKPLKTKRNSEELFFKNNYDNTRYLAKTHDKYLLLDSEDNNLRNSNKNFLKNMYDKCIESIERFESGAQEKIDIKFSSDIKIEKQKPLENRIYNDDIEMNKYLVENINTFNKNNKKKKVNIAKLLEDIRLKRDPILNLSEKFAYMNRKPLLSLFNSNDEEEKKILKKGPLAELKLRDKIIMKNLNKDNWTKNLLMKRLDEDQIKYKKGGYFFMTETNEDDDDNINNKDYNNNEDDKDKENKSIDSGNNNKSLLRLNNNDDNDNNILLKSGNYESHRNILIK